MPDQHRPVRVWTKEEETYLQTFVFPIEDRHRYTTEPWQGTAYRWFRSPNITPIEHWRRRIDRCGSNPCWCRVPDASCPNWVRDETSM
jgi:hypothetical protein